MKKPFSTRLIYKLTQLQFPKILVSAHVYREKKSKPGIVVYTYNSSTSEAKGEGLYIRTFISKAKI